MAGTSVFLSGKSHGQMNLETTVYRVAKSWTPLSDWTHAHTFTHTQKEIRLIVRTLVHLRGDRAGGIMLDKEEWHLQDQLMTYTLMHCIRPTTDWEITLKTVSDFILGGSKITADGDCSHEIKRRLLLGRKVMTNLDSILKSRDITLPTKVHLVKAMVFPVVMYGCESWTIKKPESWRIDAFELWCWRRLVRVPWTARRSNQSILKEISPGISLKEWC